MSVNQSRITKQYISIPTLLLGPIYYIYSNIFWGWIVLALSYLIYLFTDNGLTLLLLLLRNFLLAVFYKYPKKSNKNSSVLIIIEILIIHIILIMIISNIKTIEKDNTRKNSIKNMNYTISSDFTPQETNTDQHFYVNHKNEGTCYITITYSKTNITEKEYLTNETAEFTDPNNEIYEKTYNNIKWVNRNIDNLIDIYITRNKNEIYEIKFTNTTEINICANYTEDLLRTIYFN